MPIKLNYDYDNRLTEMAHATLLDRYMLPDEKSPQEAFARAATAFADDDNHAQRLYDAVGKGWFMFSTPILCNGGTTRGLPIACFGGYVGDSRQDICDHYTENAWLSSMGGGIGGYWGHIRSDGSSTSHGSKSTGSIPFIKVVDSQMLAFSQGSSRRGSYAAYQDISHPEIEEFIVVRKPTGGDTNRRSTNLNNAVVIPDSFMAKVVGTDTDPMWDLIDPHTKTVTKQVDARDLWELLLNTRIETGEPYIMFGDTVNAALPEPMKKLGLKVHQSNLCSEITLPTDKDRTFVCCLSSVNLELYNEWRDTTLIGDLVRMLDNVLTYFIETAPSQLAKAVYSASRERSIGLGAMGFHSWLQKNGIPFDSAMAEKWNREMFQHIYSRAVEASLQLASERGEAPDMAGTGMRNAHLIAVAPNASSGLICGTSPGIEPLRANLFSQKTLSGTFEVRNKFLEVRLNHYGMNTPEVWGSIVANKGSVQHLEFMSEEDRAVFRTAMEIDQHWLIHHAAVRQAWICQAQSVNLFFTPDEDGTIDAMYLHNVHVDAWRRKLKTLYYLRSEASSRAENVSTKVERKRISLDDTICLSCES